MTSIAASSSAAFFNSQPRPLSRLPPSRLQDRPRLRLSIAKNPSLGLSAAYPPVERRRRSRRDFGDSPADLEDEIYEFMSKSSNPLDFPTKDELLAAGREDLVEAIATEGGWLAYGWDLDDDDPKTQIGSGIDEGVPADLSTSLNDSEVDSCATASSSAGSMEMEGGEEAGIEGILSRLEKERSWSYSSGLGEKEVNGRSSWRVGVFENGGSISSDLGKNLFNAVYPSDGTSTDNNGTRSSTPNMWRTWSLQRAGSSTTEFEAAEIVPSEGGQQLDPNIESGVSMDDKMHKVANSKRNASDNLHGSHADAEDNFQNPIRLRLQHLESELKSTLGSVRLRTNDSISHKGQEPSLQELHMLSDALEFQETEIMNARDKLRSTRAKLAVLEGKMALEIIETQKIMEEKQRKFEAAQKALRDLRSASIVWPNSASEVLLSGSFDGWTSQRKMERSSAGIFSLCLKLYPGRYEIKFIVDGVWSVDPLRPIVWNNGHENNLLIVCT